MSECANPPQPASNALRYAVAATPVGAVLLAASARGVCALFLGDDRRELETALREEFPDALLEEDDSGLRDWLLSVTRYLRGSGPMPELPLDARGSVFQHRVWDALRAIPCGETRTYGQIAESLGQPGAARAVGRACATNPVSLLIPCHRAVRGNGELGGFRCGIERKKQLLKLESTLLRGRAAPPPLETVRV